MTPAELEKLERRAIVFSDHPAHLPRPFNELLRELIAAYKERDELLALLRKCEWSDCDGLAYCNVCNGGGFDDYKHKPDCRLAKALGK